MIFGGNVFAGDIFATTFYLELSYWMPICPNDNEWTTIDAAYADVGPCPAVNYTFGGILDAS